MLRSGRNTGGVIGICCAACSGMTKRQRKHKIKRVEKRNWKKETRENEDV